MFDRSTSILFRLEQEELSEKKKQEELNKKLVQTNNFYIRLAKAEANGYFSAGLSLGLDDFKGCYFKPTISHSGIKIAYSFYIKINGYKRIKSDEKVIIKGDKANMDQKYYINK